MKKNIPSDLEEKVAQLFIIRASGHMFDNQRQYPLWEFSNKQIKTLLKKGIGGVIFFGGTSAELHEKCKTYTKWAKFPIFLCADAEEGIGQRFQGASHFIPPMGIANIYLEDPKRAIHLAELYGRFTADQAKICGLNLILAPVCDVNTNPVNPVINMRAWGDNSETVSDLACAFHRGLSSQEVLSCAKHFPGHGDTGVDSHLELPVLNHDLNRLYEIELKPFRDIIAQGVNCIMIGHLFLKKIDSIYPATLSFEIITKLLREKLGFNGAIITDALVMDSISDKYGSEESVISAFKAGVDLLLMPSDPDKSIQSLCNEFISGRIPINRLEESLERKNKLLQSKCYSLDNNRKDNLLLNCIEIEREETRVFADQLIEKSIKFHSPYYVKKVKTGINLIRTDDISSINNQINLNPLINIPKEFGYKPIFFHERSISLLRNNIDEPLKLDLLNNVPILLQIFFRGKPFLQSNISYEPWVQIIRQLQQNKLLSGIIIYGCYYFWQKLANTLLPNIPACYSPGQMREAQKKALEKIFQAKSSGLQSNDKDITEFTD